MDDVIVELIKVEHKINQLKNELTELKAVEESLIQNVNSRMELEGSNVIEDDEIKITKVKSTKIKTLDSERLQLEMPSVFNEYQKETERKGYTRIKLK